MQRALGARGIAQGRVAAALGAIFENSIDGAVLVDLQAPELRDLGMAHPEAEALATALAEVTLSKGELPPSGLASESEGSRPSSGALESGSSNNSKSDNDSDSDSDDGLGDGGPPSIAALEAAAGDDSDDDDRPASAPQRKLSAFAAEI